MGASHTSNFTQPATFAFYKGLWMQCQGLPLIVLWAWCGIWIPDWGSPMSKDCGSNELSKHTQKEQYKNILVSCTVVAKKHTQNTKHAKCGLILNSDPLFQRIFTSLHFWKKIKSQIDPKWILMSIWKFGTGKLVFLQVVKKYK